MQYDMTRLELLDAETGSIEWTGTLDEFDAANVDVPMAGVERRYLLTNGYVVLGGGAGQMFTLRLVGSPIRACYICSRTYLEPATSCGHEGQHRLYRRAN